MSQEMNRLPVYRAGFHLDGPSPHLQEWSGRGDTGILNYWGDPIMAFDQYRVGSGDVELERKMVGEGIGEWWIKAAPFLTARAQNRLGMIHRNMNLLPMFAPGEMIEREAIVPLINISSNNELSVTVYPKYEIVFEKEYMHRKYLQSDELDMVETLNTETGSLFRFSYTPPLNKKITGQKRAKFHVGITTNFSNANDVIQYFNELIMNNEFNRDSIGKLLHVKLDITHPGEQPWIQK